MLLSVNKVNKMLLCKLATLIQNVLSSTKYWIIFWGAINQERLEFLKSRREDLPDEKYLYGSHYSTPGFVLYYLVRKVPIVFPIILELFFNSNMIFNQSISLYMIISSCSCRLCGRRNRKPKKSFKLLNN